jgi:excinuclease ABC subunit A
MAENKIVIRGAKEHNLKNINLELPRDKMIVITGVSGSGKSTLAFDTIYAEGQRRYIESLSAYARQFLEQMAKPDVEHIEGLPPTISIEQRSGGGTPRSIVATTTEIYDYMRVLFARVGTVHCYKCRKEISHQSPQQIVDQILALPVNSKIVLLAPIIRGRKGEHKDIFDRVRREGFVRVRINGKIYEVGAIKKLKLKKYKKHDVEIVIDRLIVDANIKNRLSDSVESALRIGEGLLILSVEKNGRWSDTILSELYACPECGVSVEELSPRMFSFNSPYGACSACAGLGTKIELDKELIVPQPGLSLEEGAIEPFRRLGRRMAIYYYSVLKDYAHHLGINYRMPFYKIPEAKRNFLLYGDDSLKGEESDEVFEGVIPMLERRFHNTTSDYIKRKIMDYMSELECPACKGARLKPESLAIKVGDKNIYDIIKMTIEQAYKFFDNLNFTGEEEIISKSILKEIKSRLGFLNDVGLSYLTLDRKSNTLAGGEAQRIRLASQVGSGLVGVCYVLDEPTIGLHASDNDRLLRTLKRLRDLGNTVIIVEHDEDTIKCADYLVDIGPGAGLHGGEIIAKGIPEEFFKHSNSTTIQYLTGKLKIITPQKRRLVDNENTIKLIGARENNLKNVNMALPLGTFCCVTGVSGSGKSTLIEDVLYKALRRKLYKTRERIGAYDEIIGIENIDKVIVIDQSPIGRTPRSNPATYTGVFDEIRKVFALTKESRLRGYQASRFSFNLKGGRCSSCEGQGTKIIEMHFLPDVHIMCAECKGQRYNRETLEIKYKDKNIAQVLDMEISQALSFFENIPQIARVLKTLDDVGLGYMTLGQSSITLSGGEAQRVKLASELAKTSSGQTLYLLDEPTTGLHFSDISKLLRVLNQLVDMGNTVLVIEHNMHVIKTADYIIDLGPGGGEHGGKIIATGTPEEVAANQHSLTGKVLAKYLANS